MGLCAVAAVAALGTGHSQSSAATPSAGQVSAYQWPKVVLNFLVEPEKVNAVPVSFSDLKLLEDGSPQAIQSVAGPGSPVSLCILWDISASMRTKATYAHDAAVALVQHLPPGSEVAVVTFAEKSYLTVPFTAAASFDLHALDRIEIGHRTALRDALVTSEGYFAHSARYLRRAMVIISDGGDNVSMRGNHDVERSALVPGAPLLYLLGIFAPYALSPVERLAPLVLMPLHVHMSRDSDPSVLPARAEEFARFIDSQYAFTYTSNLSTGGKRLHKLEVKLNDPAAQIRIEALQGFYTPRQ